MSKKIEGLIFDGEAIKQYLSHNHIKYDKICLSHNCAIDKNGRRHGIIYGDTDSVLINETTVACKCIEESINIEVYSTICDMLEKMRYRSPGSLGSLVQLFYSLKELVGSNKLPEKLLQFANTTLDNVHNSVIKAFE